MTTTTFDRVAEAAGELIRSNADLSPAVIAASAFDIDIDVANRMFSTSNTVALLRSKAGNIATAYSSRRSYAYGAYGNENYCNAYSSHDGYAARNLSIVEACAQSRTELDSYGDYRGIFNSCYVPNDTRTRELRGEQLFYGVDSNLLDHEVYTAIIYDSPFDGGSDARVRSINVSGRQQFSIVVGRSMRFQRIPVSRQMLERYESNNYEIVMADFIMADSDVRTIPLFAIPTEASITRELQGGASNEYVTAFMNTVHILINSPAMSRGSNIVGKIVAAAFKYLIDSRMQDVVSSNALSDADISIVNSFVAEFESSNNIIRNSQDAIHTANQNLLDLSNRIISQRETLAENIRIVEGLSDDIVGETISRVRTSLDIANRINDIRTVRSASMEVSREGQLIRFHTHPYVMESSGYRTLIDSMDISIKTWVRSTNAVVFNNRVRHPHLSGSTPCWGNAGPMIAEKIGDRDWESLVMIICGWITQYNRASPHYSISNCASSNPAPADATTGWQINNEEDN